MMQSIVNVKQEGKGFPNLSNEIQFVSQNAFVVGTNVQGEYEEQMQQNISGKPGGLKRSALQAGLESDAVALLRDGGLQDANGADSDSDSDGGSPRPGSVQSEVAVMPGMMNEVPISGIKPGKKTKGRVKIKMEFIENKLRRYTTFSKRKTGLMKKAYELSTLTGTQVMLLVASETGHVYTFATRKLQPMITSESGKALIQTCLNSPDPPPPPPGQQSQIDQRMNPSGFEEVELSYSVGDEENSSGSSVKIEGTRGYIINSLVSQDSPQSQGSPPISVNMQQQGMSSQSHTPTPQQQQVHQQQLQQHQVAASGNSRTIAMTTYLPPSVTSTNMSSSSSKQNTVAMQLPTGSITAIIPQGAGLPPGTPITISPVANGQQGQSGQQQVYRLPNTGQVLSIPASAVQGASKDGNQQVSNQGSASNQISLSGNSQMMFQTPQGVVFATPSSAAVSALPEGYILNLPQTPTLTVPPSDGQAGSATQQYITIPVPVSLANSQMLQPILAASAAALGGQIAESPDKHK